MLINLKDSVIKSDCIAAISKTIIPETNFTPVYYTVCVYIIGVSQPLIHTYEEQEERDNVYESLWNDLKRDEQ